LELGSKDSLFKAPLTITFFFGKSIKLLLEVLVFRDGEQYTIVF
jgi:hypothetical protein